MKKYTKDESILKGVREARGLTQEDLAGRIGKDTTTISRYERGGVENVSLDTLRKICLELDVHPAELLRLVTGDSK